MKNPSGVRLRADSGRDTKFWGFKALNLYGTRVPDQIGNDISGGIKKEGGNDNMEVLCQAINGQRTCQTISAQK